jgi:hypothetical protein
VTEYWYSVPVSEPEVPVARGLVAYSLRVTRNLGYESESSRARNRVNREVWSDGSTTTQRIHATLEFTPDGVEFIIRGARDNSVRILKFRASPRSSGHDVKILSKYVLKEHVGPLTFALTALTSLMLLNFISRQFGELVGKGLPWSVIAEFLLLSVPFTVALTVPMSVLVAVLYAFSRLAAWSRRSPCSRSTIRCCHWPITD